MIRGVETVIAPNLATLDTRIYIHARTHARTHISSRARVSACFFPPSLPVTEHRAAAPAAAGLEPACLATP